MRLFLIAAVLAASAAGADAPTKKWRAPDRDISTVLYSPTDVDALSVRCLPTEITSTSLDDVTCEFSQILVTKSKPSDPAALAEAKKERHKRLSAPGALKKLLGQCAESRRFLDEVHAVNIEPHKRASIARERAALESLCACKTVDCAVEAMDAEDAAATANACNVTATHIDRKFKRQSPTQWVSVSGPDGVCNIVLTLVLEYNPDEGSWSYIQKRTVTSSDPKCQGFESTFRSYSHHRYFRNAVMNCETIDSLMP